MSRLLSKKASNADNIFGTKARVTGAIWLIIGIAMIVLSIIYVKPF